MSWLERQWQRQGVAATLLSPVSALYGALLKIRRLLYEKDWLGRPSAPLPVIVVGNLSVGGTGKTPLCAYLVEQFTAAGWRPAIVSRGYGGTRHLSPHLLTSDDVASHVGDEPLMLFQQTGVPVCVCVDRAEAVKKVAEITDANVVISDDGLQHLKMRRDAEILVVDGSRGFGNCRLIPAGPLRDTLGSVSTVDLVAVQMPSSEYPVDFELSSTRVGANTDVALAESHSDTKVKNRSTTGFHKSLLNLSSRKGFNSIERSFFCLKPTEAVDLSTGEKVDIGRFSERKVHAVAGIGHPQRFFDSLKALGINVEEHPMPDHAPIALDDVTFDDNLPVFVTAKDAVKLAHVSRSLNQVYRIDTRLDTSSGLGIAIKNLIKKMDSVSQGYKQSKNHRDSI